MYYSVMYIRNNVSSDKTVDKNPPKIQKCTDWPLWTGVVHMGHYLVHSGHRVATIDEPEEPAIFDRTRWCLDLPISEMDAQYLLTRMRANAQRDGRLAEHMWRPLFNAANFGLRSLILDAVQ